MPAACWSVTPARPDHATTWFGSRTDRLVFPCCRALSLEVLHELDETIWVGGLGT